MQTVELRVAVQDSTWAAYADPTIPESAEVFQALVDLGGISESVAPGTYIFKREQLDDEHFVYSLDLME